MQRIPIPLVVAAGFGLVSLVIAAEPEVYPAKGQSESQQERDQYECHEWATKETGVDPVAMAEQKLDAAPTPAAEQAGSGARGAGMGAIRGAEGGDAAGGAARGFGIGRMLSVLKSKRQLREQNTTTTQGGAAVHQQLDKYDRAYAACLTGRGYSVK